MVKSRWIVIVVVALVLMGMFAGCTQEATPTPTPTPTPTQLPAGPDWEALGFTADAPRPIEGVAMPKLFRIGAGSAIGDQSDLCGKWAARQIEQGYPEMSVRVFPGSVKETPVMLANGDIDLSYAAPMFDGMAYDKPYADLTEPATMLRHVATNGATFYFVFVAEDSPIQSIADLKDKNIGVRPATSVSNKLAKLTLGAYGITFDSITANGGLVFVGSGTEIATKIIEGTLDAGMYIQPAPDASALMIQEAKGIRLLPLTEEAIQAALDVYPMEIGDIPAGTYKGQTDDYTTIAVPSAWATTIDVPDDVLYNCLAWMFRDGGESYQALLPGLKSWKVIDDCAFGAQTPFHPGAAKYFRAWGVEIPDDEVKGRD